MDIYTTRRMGVLDSPVSRVDEDRVMQAMGRRDERVDMVVQMFESAKKARGEYDKEWEYYNRLFRGIHWEDKKPIRGSDWRSYLTINYLKAIIMSIEAVLQDNSPRITVSATSPYQQPYTMTLQKGIDQLWDRRKISRALSHSSLNARIYGLGYMKAVYDWTLEEGLGDIAVYSCPPSTIYPDPAATEPGNAAFIIERKRVNKAWIRERWPEWVGKLKPDATGSGSGKGTYGCPSSGYDPALPFKYWSPTGGDIRVGDQVSFNSPPYKSGSGIDDDWYWHFEVWMIDRHEEVKTVPVMIGMNPFTQQPVYDFKQFNVPRYPNGRLIHMVGGEILHDGPVPYPVWPYIKIQGNTVPDEWAGTGEPEDLKDLQLEGNKRRSQIVDHACLMGNTIWVLDTNSGVQPHMLTNKPGQIVWKNPGSDVRRLEPPGMPNYITALSQMPFQDMEKLSGVSSAATSGAPPRGARSGHAMEAGNNIATQRIRSRGRELEMAIESLGRIIIALMQLFYTIPRWVRLTGDAGSVYFVPFDGRTIRGSWDIKCDSSSSSPISKASRASQALELVKYGLIDQRAALEVLEWPGYEEILRRMNVAGGPVQQHYAGWPGVPSKGSPSDHTGYATSIRSAPPPQAPPTAGPPGGGPPPGSGGPMASAGPGLAQHNTKGGGKRR